MDDEKDNQVLSPNSSWCSGAPIPMANEIAFLMTTIAKAVHVTSQIAETDVPLAEVYCEQNALINKDVIVSLTYATF